MDNFFENLVKGTNRKILKTNICRYCGEKFPFFDIEKDIYDKHEFKYPDLCGLCTFKMFNSYINDRHLYQRIDTQDNKKIISILSENFTGTVLEANKYKDYLTDDYALNFSKDIKSNSFSNVLDDFKKLYDDFPKPSRLVFNELHNGEYSSHNGWAKNVYLSYCVFNDCEDIYYSFRVVGGCKNIFNSYNLSNSTNIYNSKVVGNSYDISFCDTIVFSSNLLFCREMNNCSECIFCCNQVNKKYMVFNVQYEKEEYLKIKQDILSRIKDYKNFVFLKNKYEEFLEKNLILQSHDTCRCEGVVGETTYDSKNIINSFSCNTLENGVNLMSGGDGDGDVNIDIFNSIEFGTNVTSSIGSCSFGMNTYNVFFSKYVTESKNVYYGIDVEGCEEVMFCIGLRNKKHCILNKQYEKEEYFKLKKQIIESLKKQNKWGEFLGFDMSMFPYNDTLAYDIFKVNKVIYKSGKQEIINKNSNGIVTLLGDDFVSDAILDLGGAQKLKIKWRTSNKEINISDNMDVIQSKDLPNIDDLDDSILQKVFICEKTNRPFKIIKKELDYLKKKGLPIPRIHNEERIDSLLSSRPLGKFYIGICDKCSKETLTVYKDKPNCRVYCPDCYNDYMYN